MNDRWIDLHGHDGASQTVPPSRQTHLEESPIVALRCIVVHAHRGLLFLIRGSMSPQPKNNFVDLFHHGNDDETGPAAEPGQQDPVSQTFHDVVGECHYQRTFSLLPIRGQTPLCIYLNGRMNEKHHRERLSLPSSIILLIKQIERPKQQTRSKRNDCSVIRTLPTSSSLIDLQPNSY